MEQEIELGQAEIGELVMWKTRSFGDILAEVNEKFQHEEVTYKVLVTADNNIKYEWNADMKVIVDR